MFAGSSLRLRSRAFFSSDGLFRGDNIYAETFIIPAAVGEYTIRPHGVLESKQCATIKALVRTRAEK